MAGRLIAPATASDHATPKIMAPSRSATCSRGPVESGRYRERALGIPPCAMTLERVSADAQNRKAAEVLRAEDPCQEDPLHGDEHPHCSLRSQDMNESAAEEATHPIPGEGGSCQAGTSRMEHDRLGSSARNAMSRRMARKTISAIRDLTVQGGSPALCARGPPIAARSSSPQDGRELSVSYGRARPRGLCKTPGERGPARSPAPAHTPVPCR